jgi:hypothetical protein
MYVERDVGIQSGENFLVYKVVRTSSDELLKFCRLLHILLPIASTNVQLILPTTVILMCIALPSEVAVNKKTDSVNDNAYYDHGSFP